MRRAQGNEFGTAPSLAFNRGISVWKDTQVHKLAWKLGRVGACN